MADKAFAIQNEIASLNVKLNIPSFLGGRAKLTKAEVKFGLFPAYYDISYHR